MRPIDDSIVEKLKDVVPDLKILKPSSPGYEESLKRFNPDSERRAVRLSLMPYFRNLLPVFTDSQRASSCFPLQPWILQRL
jgi:hypothetical protein